MDNTFFYDRFGNKVNDGDFVMVVDDEKFLNYTPGEVLQIEYIFGRVGEFKDYYSVKFKKMNYCRFIKAVQMRKLSNEEAMLWQLENS